MKKYPLLETLIVERGIRKTVIAKSLGVTERTLNKKVNGDVPFTWDQVCIVQRKFFPDKTKDDLFAVDDEKTPAA